ncbi:unnamed protein product [Sordaria macrospora k-hell]|uniref:WGS project CABT00000000 data, contig 2.9 n=1 Tax=Sordaria macrospora (strain ATCC MYA-333 / DSM 997 / K(L3346) / K-hell) TaxID=771870 RepID=F7VVX2_SORMK|nr:uncharacterized protein SMAC_03696 [Sordaria macrospora k-hell]CCC09663.1 unnamed protein product [Sordaria macrospora k-hell]
MSQSLAKECNELKERYDTCFLKWYSEKYLRGTGTEQNNECSELFKQYSSCLQGAWHRQAAGRGPGRTQGQRLDIHEQEEITDLLRALSDWLLASELSVMPEDDGLMRVFWPTDLPRSDCRGVVVGWRNSALDVLVVAVLEEVEPRRVESALKLGNLLRNAPHPVSRIYEQCGKSSISVLGVSNTPDTVEVDSSWIRVTIPPKQRVPSVTCARASSIQIILFERPLPGRMQYMSLDPIALALGDKHDGFRQDFADSGEEDDEKRERLNKEAKRKLVEKLKQHSVVKRIPSPKERALPTIINQINWAWELEKLLQQNVSRIGTRPKRALSVSERVVESATTARDMILVWLWDMITIYVLPVIKKLFVLGLMAHRVVAEMLLRILEWRLRPRYAALKDISATAQQVEIRLQQFCYWPMQYVTLRLRKNDWASVTTSHPDYIRFYNSLWLVANDVIIGMAFGSYIIDNADWVANEISRLLTTYTVEALQSSISWLMGWPAGLKLNTELAAFLGDLFLWVIEYWASGIRYELRDTQDIGTTCNDNNPLRQHPSTSVIALHPIPLDFKSMFYQYFQMGNRIRKHYLSPRVAMCLLMGKFVPPLNRKNLYSLQYSMLPAKRAGVMEMWDALNSLPASKRKSMPVQVPILANGRNRFPSNYGGGRSRSYG